MQLPEEFKPTAIGTFDALEHIVITSQQEMDKVITIRDDKMYATADIYAKLGETQYFRYLRSDDEISPFMRDVLLELMRLGWLYQ